MKENIVLTEAVYYILLSLFKPMHGYGIMQNTMELSNNRVKLAPGTLYGAINTLLENGWITAVSSDDNSRKKDYVITDLGKEIVSNELERLKELVKNGDFIIGGEK
jgi:DNA-binding PadR family transcriptional regulator